MEKLLAVSLIAIGIVGCDGYEAPCRLASEIALVDDGAETGFSLVDAPQIGLVRLRYGPAADGGGAALGAVSVRIPTGADVLRIDDDGNVVSRRSFTVPEELSARKGSTSDIGVVATDDEALFHWVEESTQTLPDGTTTTSSVLRLKTVRSDGRVGDLLSPPLARCTDCKLTSSAAAYGGALLVLYTKTFSSTPPAIEDPEVGLLTISGSVVGSTDVPWLADRVRKLGVPRLDTTGDRLLCFAGTSAWSVDAALAPRAGPLELPSAASAFNWNPEQDDAVVVWSSSPSDGGTATGTTPDLVFREIGERGAAHGPIVRISTALRVFDVARQGDRTGVVLSSDDGHAYFALLGPSGRKIGGDLDTGRAFVGSSHVLRARARGHFVDVLSWGGRVLRREVVCGS